jgi:hypothetical protein
MTQAARQGSADPSALVVNRVVDSFRYTKRNRRQRYMFLAAAVLLLFSFLTAAASAIDARLAAFDAAISEQAKVVADRASDEALLLQTEAELRSRVARFREGESENAKILADAYAADAASKADAAEERGREARRLEAEAVAERIEAEAARDKARSEGRARELSERAVAQLAFDPEAGVLEAKTAYETAPVPSAADALRRSLLDSRVRSILRAPSGTPGNFVSVTGASFDQRGELALTSSSDGVARVWQARTGELLATLTVGAGERREKDFLRSARFSPSGDYVAAAGNHDTVYLWDWRPEERRAEMISERARGPRRVEAVFAPRAEKSEGRLPKPSAATGHFGSRPFPLNCSLNPGASVLVLVEQAALLQVLTLEAVARPGHRVQALLGDGLAAVDALAVLAALDPLQSLVDELEELPVVGRHRDQKLLRVGVGRHVGRVLRRFEVALAARHLGLVDLCEERLAARQQAVAVRLRLPLIHSVACSFSNPACP